MNYKDEGLGLRASGLSFRVRCFEDLSGAL